MNVANRQVKQAQTQVRQEKAQIAQATQASQNARKQTILAQRQTQSARQQLQVADSIRKAVEIEVDVAKASASRIAGRKLESLVQGMRAGAAWQRLAPQLDTASGPAQVELLTARSQVQAALMDVYGTNERNSLKGHQGSVLSVAFSPDGRSIVSGGDDGTVKLADWDVDKLMQLACEWTGDYLRTSLDVSAADAMAMCGIRK